MNQQNFDYSDIENKHFVVNCDTYPFDIFCFFGPSTEKFNKTLGKYLKAGIIDKDEHDHIINYDLTNTTEGSFVMSPTSFCVLYCKNLPDSIENLAILNHEIYHIVTEILTKVGIVLTRESTEAFAYLTQYLSEEIYANIGLVPAIMELIDEELIIDEDEENIKNELSIYKYFLLKKEELTVAQQKQQEFIKGFLFGKGIFIVEKDGNVSFNEKHQNYKEYYNNLKEL